MIASVAPEHRQWLRDMYRTLDFLMRNGNWDTVNRFILEYQVMLKTKDACVSRQIAILRFLSSAPREKIPEWEHLLWRVGLIVGEDSRRLRGLK